MAVLQIQAAPFFASKNRAFWNLQLAGWTGAFIYRGVVAVSNDQPLDLLALVLVTTITGYSISLVLSVIYRHLIRQRPFVTWGVTALVLMAAVMLHTSIDTWMQGIYYAGSRDTPFAQRFVGLSFLPLTLLGGWSALYYAINFFLTVEQQADRLERLEAQATAAQLAMLRYQLNPHFLFNTLNSISTLVLLKQTEPANAMLTRLSGFLRHTLIAEPGSQVTLAQEIETLQLYLDIERMRFEERLRTHFEIDDAALSAQLPAMLLQPLVENAIKYAVSPQEEGARILLTARVLGDRLRLTVEDTGPGVDEPLRYETRDAAELRADLRAGHAPGQPISTGVGLANIRNRLMQAYGDAHLFETRSEAGGGFIVLIEIPYTRADTAESPGASARTPASAPANPAASAPNRSLTPPQPSIGTPA